MLRLRRAEAAKSVIVEFAMGTDIQFLSNKVKSLGGRIKDAFFYKVNNKVVSYVNIVLYLKDFGYLHHKVGQAKPFSCNVMCTCTTFHFLLFQ